MTIQLLPFLNGGGNFEPLFSASLLAALSLAAFNAQRDPMR